MWINLLKVSALNGILKQGRLPDTLDSLAERIPLGARYYIKRSDSSDPLVPAEQIHELTKEGEVTFLHLNPVELAFQLTLEVSGITISYTMYFFFVSHA